MTRLTSLRTAGPREVPLRGAVQQAQRVASVTGPVLPAPVVNAGGAAGEHPHLPAAVTGARASRLLSAALNRDGAKRNRSLSEAATSREARVRHLNCRQIRRHIPGRCSRTCGEFHPQRACVFAQVG